MSRTFDVRNIFGSTTVPPPSTGQFNQGAAAPYYQGLPPAGSTAPPVNGADPYAPPAGGFRSSAVDQRTPSAGISRPDPYQQSASWTDRAAQRYGGPGARYAADDAASADRYANMSQAPTSADPMERPWSNGRPSRGTVQLASATEPINTAPINSAPLGADRVDAAPVANNPNASMSRSAPFGHARDYSWLKGQLEAGPDGLQLRYLPSNTNRVDQYGGVMPLGDSRSLDGFSDGQYVAVQGAVVHEDDQSGGFIPRYSLQRIKPLEP